MPEFEEESHNYSIMKYMYIYYHFEYIVKIILSFQFDLLNSNSEISAASGLIFTLFLHFVVSVVSVYRCALQMCSR